MMINPQNSYNQSLSLTPRSPRWRVTVENGVHWLLAPSGQKFYGSGVNGVDAGSPPEEVEGRPAYYLWDLYDSVDQWAQIVRDRLGRWGFNHLGAWNFAVEQIGLPYVANLDLGRWSEALWFDAFDPALPTRVRECAERLTAPHRESGLRIGYFPDNEVGWWNTSLFEFYLSKGWENHTKRLLWQLLHDRYEADWRALLKDWVPVPALSGFDSIRDAGVALRLRPGGAGIHLVNHFTFLCAQRYYQLMHDGLRNADPEALIFSDRLPIYYSQDAVRAMGPYVDVIAVNYDLDGPDSWLAHYFFEGLALLTGKPVFISEFFCAAMENRSRNKNTGHLLKVATQTERAKVVQQALQNFARFPHIIGTHWFQYYDEPQGGRSDGEDYNMGLVDIYDQPYDKLVDSFARTNSTLHQVHAQAKPLTPPAHGHGDNIRENVGVIDLSDASLADWDKDNTLLHGFTAPPPHVPFADVYFTWNANGLYLATIGMDYVNPEDLAYDGEFPLSETYQVHLLLIVRERAHHYVVHFIPQEAAFSPDDSTNARGSIIMVPRLYTYPADGAPRPLSGATAQHLKAESPRISCETRFPASLFNLPSFKSGMELKMNIVVISHYRAQEMFWSEGTAKNTFARPEGWRRVILE